MNSKLAIDSLCTDSYYSSNCLQKRNEECCESIEWQILWENMQLLGNWNKIVNYLGGALLVLAMYTAKEYNELLLGRYDSESLKKIQSHLVNSC